MLIGCVLVWALNHSPAFSASLPLVLLKNFIRLLPYVFVIDQVTSFADYWIHILRRHRAVAESNGFQRFLYQHYGASGIFGTRAGISGLFALTLALGVPLSFCWRKSGTLLLPGVAHAVR